MITKLVPQCMQSFSPGGDQEGHFQAIFGLPKGPQKILTFSKLIIFNCFKPWDPSHRLPHAQNTSPNTLVDPWDHLGA